MWYCKLKNHGLPSHVSQLLVKLLRILALSPECSFLVASAQADIYFTTNVFFEFKGFSLSKMMGDGAIWLTYLVSATSSL